MVNYSKKKQIKRFEDLPEEHREFILDTAEFTRKYTPPTIAKTLGMTKQGLDYHINNRKAKHE